MPIIALREELLWCTTALPVILSKEEQRNCGANKPPPNIAFIVYLKDIKEQRPPSLEKRESAAIRVLVIQLAGIVTIRPFG